MLIYLLVLCYTKSNIILEDKGDIMNTDILTNETENNQIEVTPTMDDFKDQIDGSFEKLKEGDIVTGTVIGVSDAEVTLDLGTYAEGVIQARDLSNDPDFSIENDIAKEDKISAMVIKEDDGEGKVLLSKKKADEIISWDYFKEILESKEKFTVKISQSVNAGVITFVKGLRGFIPASQLSLSYVEDLSTWVGKEIEVIAITVDKNENRLVFSGKEVEREAQSQDRENIMNQLEVGSVVTGKVDGIMPYGAFVNIGGGLSGLVHISQMSQKRIDTPNEVVKQGQEVKVKITKIENGKISLSMKATEERKAQPAIDRGANVKSSYNDGEVTTGLGALLKNINL